MSWSPNPTISRRCAKRCSFWNRALRCLMLGQVHFRSRSGIARLRAVQFSTDLSDGREKACGQVVHFRKNFPNTPTLSFKCSGCARRIAREPIHQTDQWCPKKFILKSGVSHGYDGGPHIGLTAVRLIPSPFATAVREKPPCLEGCIMKLILDGTHPAQCPECGSASLHRSRRKGTVESLLYHALFISPYRCGECFERHFRFRSAKEARRPSAQHPKHAS